MTQSLVDGKWQQQAHLADRQLIGRGGCTINQNTMLPGRPPGKAIDDSHMQSPWASKRLWGSLSSLRKGKGKIKAQSASTPYVCHAIAYPYMFLCIYICIFKHDPLLHNYNNNIYHFKVKSFNYIYLFPDYKSSKSMTICMNLECQGLF